MEVLVNLLCTARQCFTFGGCIQVCGWTKLRIRCDDMKPEGPLDSLTIGHYTKRFESRGLLGSKYAELVRMPGVLAGLL